MLMVSAKLSLETLQQNAVGKKVWMHVMKEAHQIGILTEGTLMQFENLPISLSSFENNVLKILC